MVHIEDVAQLMSSSTSYSIHTIAPVLSYANRVELTAHCAHIGYANGAASKINASLLWKKMHHNDSNYTADK